MRKAIFSIYSKIFIFGAGLFLMGCASDPVPTYLPAIHPAHPDAAEVVYSPTPNPFQNGISMNKMQPDETPKMSPGGHEDSHPDQMKSKDKHHEKPIETKTEKPVHHHKESN
jgi:hypothetical protein